MTLASPLYFAFLAVVMIVVGFTRTQPWRLRFLLAASWVFYAWWDWRFSALLLGVTVCAYAAGYWMPRVPRSRRMAVLVAAVAANLGALAVFKYLGFLSGSAAALAGVFGMSLPIAQLVLPVGISFMTFQAIAYIVDVYREEIEPAEPIDVALLIAFFPHVLAGPILRPAQFIGQLRGEVRARAADLSAGVQQFVAGLAMKVLIADRLAVFTSRVMERPGTYDDPTLWLATFAYSVQIYADFAGYSSMAIGSARMLGIYIPPNFLAPYGSLNVAEFWRRWHISLSTWLRTYLYIPLGGNRRGLPRQLLNLLIVMLLAGLWHGASWSFVLWGGLHGVGLAVHRLWTLRSRNAAGPSWLGASASWAATWLFVSLAWVFFRITDISVALTVMGRMLVPGDTGGVTWMATWALILVPAVVVCSIVYARRPVVLTPMKLVSFRGAFVGTMLVIALLVFWPTVATPFVYLQF